MRNKDKFKVVRDDQFDNYGEHPILPTHTFKCLSLSFENWGKTTIQIRG